MNVIQQSFFCEHAFQAVNKSPQESNNDNIVNVTLE
jgi:hypothetical protein